MRYLFIGNKSILECFQLRSLLRNEKQMISSDWLKNIDWLKNFILLKDCGN